MIGLDFGILYTVQARVAGLPGSNTGFYFEPDLVTAGKLRQIQTVYRFLENKAHVFVSDVVGTYEEEIVGSQRLARLKEINQLIRNTLLLRVRNRNVFSLIELDFRPEDLSALEDLPTTFKRIYFIDGRQLPGANPIGQTDIIGLAPRVLAMEKAKVESLTYLRENKLIAPNEEDDETVQFDFSQLPAGLYEISLAIPPPKTRKFYADPALYAQPPFAVVEIEVPAGAFTLQEFTIEFKEK